jgi:hypothetical protein
LAHAICAIALAPEPLAHFFGVLFEIPVRSLYEATENDFEKFDQGGKFSIFHELD